MRKFLSAHPMPPLAKRYMKQLAFKSSEKSLTTHHVEGNSMASPTQMVVGKDIPYSLIAEGLLKILRDLNPTFPFKSHTNSRPWNGRTTKSCNYFSSKIITNWTCHVNIIPLAYPTVRLTLYLQQWFLSIFPADKISTCQFLSIEWQVH